MNFARTNFLRFIFSIKRIPALSTNLRQWTSAFGGTSIHVITTFSESGGLIFKVEWINYGWEFYFLCLCSIWETEVEGSIQNSRRFYIK